MSEILTIRQPRTNKEFELMYDLRWRILRKPWNQPKGSEKDPLDGTAVPFIAILRNQIIGTARYHKINENIAQIRFLAVDENYRKKGIGKSMMEAIHVTAQNQSIKFLILNARETAKKFFEKFGYKVMEEGPLLFGEIKHFKMVKRLVKSNAKMKEIIENLKRTLES